MFHDLHLPISPKSWCTENELKLQSLICSGLDFGIHLGTRSELLVFQIPIQRLKKCFSPLEFVHSDRLKISISLENTTSKKLPLPLLEIIVAQWNIIKCCLFSKLDIIHFIYPPLAPHIWSNFLVGTNSSHPPGAFPWFLPGLQQHSAQRENRLVLRVIHD